MENKSGRIRLSDKAYKLIRELIITLQLRPGELVEEGALERQLNIGRTPIREALQRLAMDGLIDQVAGRGFLVRPMSIDDVKNLFEAMMAIEQVVVQLAAQRIRPHEIEQLAKINEQHKEALSQQDYFKVTGLNIAFHREFCAATGNSFLISAMEGLHHQSERLGYLTYSKEVFQKDFENYNALAVNDHEDLLRCFAERDANRPVEIITSHCNRFFLRVCHYMGPHTSLSTPSKIDSDLMNPLTTRND